jgi:hypothetical protein
VPKILGTITSKHKDFELVSIHLPFFPEDIVPVDSTQNVEDETYSEWIALDRAFVRLWELLPIRVVAIWTVGSNEAKVTEEQLWCFLKRSWPEATKKGILDLRRDNYE